MNQVMLCHPYGTHMALIIIPPEEPGPHANLSNPSKKSTTTIYNILPVQPLNSNQQCTQCPSACTQPLLRLKRRSKPYKHSHQLAATHWLIAGNQPIIPSTTSQGPLELHLISFPQDAFQPSVLTPQVLAPWAWNHFPGPMLEAFLGGTPITSHCHLHPDHRFHWSSWPSMPHQTSLDRCC